MGRGILKKKKEFKHQFNSQLYRDYQRVLAENKQLKEDPNGVIAPFIERYNAAVLQNNRLSALSASMIDQLGGKVEVTKAAIEAFQGYRLSIKIETPEGVEKFEDADRYIFTYEKSKSEAPTTVMPAQKPEEVQTAPTPSPDVILAPIPISGPKPGDPDPNHVHSPSDPHVPGVPCECDPRTEAAKAIVEEVTTAPPVYQGIDLAKTED